MAADENQTQTPAAEAALQDSSQTPTAEAALQDSGQTPAAIEEAPEEPGKIPSAAEPPPLEELPVLTVRDTVIFPGALLPITVGRPSSVALVQSLGENRTLAVISQLDPRVDTPGPEDLYEVGTLCVMHKAIRVPKDNLLLFCEGMERIRTRGFTGTEPFLKARVERIP